MSFRQRLQWSFVGVAVVIPTAAVVGLVLTARRTEERDLDDALVLEAREELNSLRGRGTALMPQLSEDLIAPEYGTELVRYARLFGTSGAVVAQNRAMATCKDMAALPAPLPVRGFDMRCGDLLLRAVVRDAKDDDAGPLLVAVPRTSLDADTRFMVRLAAAFMVVSALVATLVSIWLTRRLAKGLERIAETSRRVALGDLNARIPLAVGDAEVRELAHNINHMVEQIQTLLGSQESFIAHAAHELRSPLTTLYGELSLALRKDRSNEEYKRALGEAYASASHMKHLAEALLELARAGQKSQPAVEACTIGEAVTQAIAAREALAKVRNIRVRAEGPAQLRPLALSTHVERMVGNLVENALKHGPQDSEVLVHWSAEAHVLMLHVDDQGPGIVESERDRLFDPFYRGAKHRADDSSGFGLGLAIVRELARKNRGTVTISGAHTMTHGGTRFTITLPLLLPSGEAS